MTVNKGMKVERDRLEAEGTVIDASNGKFKVEVSEGYVVLCSLAGKVRMNGIKILVGDRVRIQIGEYDPSMGRIVFRLK
jgi:translation initiation factor IF-1